MVAAAVRETKTAAVKEREATLELVQADLAAAVREAQACAIVQSCMHLCNPNELQVHIPTSTCCAMPSNPHFDLVVCPYMRVPLSVTAILASSP